MDEEVSINTLSMSSNLPLIIIFIVIISSMAGCLSETEETIQETNSCNDNQAASALEPRVSEHTIIQEIEGEQITRRYLIQAPTIIEASKCYPILFALHGNGGQPDQFVGQFREMIDEGNFIGIYPEGIERSWNLGKEASTANDTEFIESIADSIKLITNIDHQKRYVVGFSNGAGMAHTLGIESDYFSAFVAVVTSLTVENIPTNNSSNPSVMQILGEDDESIPYEGGEGVMGHIFLPGNQSARVWAEHNNCNLTAENTTLSDGSIRSVYSDCIDNGEVINYKVANTGHSINQNFEGGLNSLIWRFLANH